ncbi:hypothetical protein ABEG17_16395 [Pedococcus sp. KACC 23699]|uniref:Uncharacterized protein n=1 Tax=Pedococcus sp. KACC 23699 TaxID=3149228 RepID=A0AAU7JS53_9MICO
METDTAALARMGPQMLVTLAMDIRLAREEVRIGRIEPVLQISLLSARQKLLRAMEVYADELTARRLPVPHQLHDELRLLRDIRRQPQGRAWHRRG